MNVDASCYCIATDQHTTSGGIFEFLLFARPTVVLLLALLI